MHPHVRVRYESIKHKFALSACVGGFVETKNTIFDMKDHVHDNQRPMLGKTYSRTMASHGK